MGGMDLSVNTFLGSASSSKNQVDYFTDQVPWQEWTQISKHKGDLKIKGFPGLRNLFKAPARSWSSLIYDDGCKIKVMVSVEKVS